jgi:hypothetical protein
MLGIDIHHTMRFSYRYRDEVFLRIEQMALLYIWGEQYKN